MLDHIRHSHHRRSTAKAVTEDQRHDPGLARLAGLAAERLSMPLALISLLDCGQRWTHVGSGFPASIVVPTIYETCTTILFSPARPFVVHDVGNDPRFVRDPILSALGVEFLAATSILDVDGRIVGLLVVLDRQRRSFDQGATLSLFGSAKAISSRLQDRKALARLRASRESHRRAHVLVRPITWNANADGTIIHVNRHWASTTGIVAESYRNDDWVQAIHPDERSRVVADWRTCLGKAQPHDTSFRLRLADGTYHWYRVTASVRRDVDGTVVGWTGLLEDVNDRTLSDLALFNSERRLVLALDAARLGTWDLDLSTHVLVVSDRCAANFGLARAPALTSYRQLLDLIHPDDRQRQEAMLHRCFLDGDDLETEYRTIWPDLSTHWVRMTGRCIFSEAGEPAQVVGLSLDITAHRKAEEEIRHIAYHDFLTGLANRRLLNERLDHALAEVTPDAGVALLCIDLDHFKTINDALGHAAGDRALHWAGSCLKRWARPGDVVARYGGDEFAVLMTRVGSRDEVEQHVAGLLAAFEEPVELEGRSVVLGLSLGISMAFRNDVSPGQLINEADLALYRAKSEGRGDRRFFRSDIDKPMQAEQLLKISLQQGFDCNEFRLAYQPLLDTQTGRIIGFEALLRWQHPERGLLGPTDFIKVAEESDLMVSISRWVMEEACSEAMKWPRSISISVNLPPAHAARDDFEQHVLIALERSGLPANRLELEITERTVLAFDDTMRRSLGALQRRGVRVVLDDFGTGYASLTYLRRFRFDKIKIDKSFLTDLPDGQCGDAIMQAIIALCQTLKIATTAEGVESDAQFQMVRRHGCTEVQGFHFSPPVLPGNIPDLLRVAHAREGSVTG